MLITDVCDTGLKTRPPVWPSTVKEPGLRNLRFEGLLQYLTLRAGQQSSVSHNPITSLRRPVTPGIFDIRTRTGNSFV